MTTTPAAVSLFPFVVIDADNGTIDRCATLGEANRLAATEPGARVEYQPEPHSLDRVAAPYLVEVNAAAAEGPTLAFEAGTYRSADEAMRVAFRAAHMPSVRLAVLDLGHRIDHAWRDLLDAPVHDVRVTRFLPADGEDGFLVGVARNRAATA